MEAERRFNAAVKVIQGLPKDGSFQPSNEMKLKFYSHYKQATQGKCTQARPSFWDPIGRAKHDGWAALGDMTKEDAMNGYVEALMQIIETMNFSADVETFMEMLGPFYEFVEDKINPRPTGGSDASPAANRREDEAKNLGEILAGADKYPLNDLEMESGSSDAGSDQVESVHSLEDMLGQFVPPSDNFNYNSVRPDQEFLDQIKGSRTEDDRKAGSFAAAYNSEQQLSRQLNNSSLTLGKMDLNHNAFNQQEERFLSELRDTQSSLEATRGLMKEIHQYKRNLTGQESQSVEPAVEDDQENFENLSKELSKVEIDRMLDRFEGFTQPLPSKTNSDKSSAATNSKSALGNPSGSQDKNVHQPMDENEDDSEDEIFEDSMDFSENPQADRAMVKSKGYASLSSAFSEEDPIESSNLTDKKHLRAPCHGRKMSRALRRELEEDQILIVSSQTNPETITMSNVSSDTHNKDDDRYMEGVILQLSRDLTLVNSNLNHINENIGHMADCLDHVTARIGSMEANVVQMSSRISTLEYLVQVLLSREESWFDRQSSKLTVAAGAGVLAMVLAKVFYSRRR